MFRFVFVTSTPYSKGKTIDVALMMQDARENKLQSTTRYQIDYSTAGNKQSTVALQLYSQFRPVRALMSSCQFQGLSMTSAGHSASDVLIGEKRRRTAKKLGLGLMVASQYSSTLRTVCTTSIIQRLNQLDNTLLCCFTQLVDNSSLLVSATSSLVLHSQLC